jgi:pimeloyl-ACP methyl ester carboxylesterase
MPYLVADLLAVVDHFSRGKKAIVVGHDWGGAVAWSFAMQHPDRIERLVIFNLPHPRGLMRELATNPKQQSNSQYAVEFQKPDAASKLTAEALAGWVSDPNARKKYIEAFGRTSFDGMLNYYKANYPRVPDSTAEDASQKPTPTMPNVKCPVLMFHGLKDEALLASGLNDTWDWVDSDLTIVTIPGAGHFVQQDASELVSRRMLAWLRD